MLAGRRPSSIGVYDNAAELPAGTPTITHLLRAAGYATVLTGKMHFVGPDQLHGFEQRLTSDVYPAAFDWTPDSKQILAAWQDDDTDPETDLCALPEPDSGIYLLPAAGGPPRRIFTEKFVRIFGQELIGDLVPQATFSPDGKLVAFIARRRYQGNGDLYDTIIVMRANGTDARAVHYAGPKVVNQGTGFWTPAWQPLPR